MRESPSKAVSACSRDSTRTCTDAIEAHVTAGLLKHKALAMAARADSVDTVLGSLVTEVEAHVQGMAFQRARRSEAGGQQPPTLRAESASSDALSGDTYAERAASVEQKGWMTLGSDAQPVHVANLIPGQSDTNGQDILSGGQHKLLLQATGSSYYSLGPQKGLVVPSDAPESLTKSSKLLALKQRRLDSLSSSLDLSRESSFDTSAQHLSSQHVQPLDTSDHASSKSPLPLDSTTGVSLDSVTRCMCNHMM